MNGTNEEEKVIVVGKKTKKASTRLKSIMKERFIIQTPVEQSTDPVEIDWASQSCHEVITANDVWEWSFGSDKWWNEKQAARNKPD